MIKSNKSKKKVVEATSDLGAIDSFQKHRKDLTLKDNIIGLDLGIEYINEKMNVIRSERRQLFIKRELLQLALKGVKASLKED
jgi:hypothetical protein